MSICSMMDVCFFIFAFNFLYHIPNLIHRCMAIWFRNKITPGSPPILFQCSSSFPPEDAEIAEIVRCRMFSGPSFDPFAIVDGVFAIIIKPWFTRVFGIYRGLWYGLITYWYHCFVKLQDWIRAISYYFCLKFFSAHLFIQRPVSFVKFIPCRSFAYSRI